MPEDWALQRLAAMMHLLTATRQPYLLWHLINSFPDNDKIECVVELLIHRGTFFSVLASLLLLEHEPTIYTFLRESSPAVRLIQVFFKKSLRPDLLHLLLGSSKWKRCLAAKSTADYAVALGDFINLILDLTFADIAPAVLVITLVSLWLATKTDAPAPAPAPQPDEASSSTGPVPRLPAIASERSFTTKYTIYDFARECEQQQGTGLGLARLAKSVLVDMQTNWSSCVASIFFLRLLCPIICQPTEAADTLSSAVIQAAKVLQLLANGSSHTSHDFDLLLHQKAGKYQEFCQQTFHDGLLHFPESLRSSPYLIAPNDTVLISTTRLIDEITGPDQLLTTRCLAPHAWQAFPTPPTAIELRLLNLVLTPPPPPGSAPPAPPPAPPRV
jgi:hypothetical protein